MIATQTTIARRIALAAVVVALSITACRPAPLGTTDVYIVKSVGEHAVNGFIPVTCESTKHPGTTKTVQWDVLAQVGPEVGDEWRCNSGGG